MAEQRGESDRKHSRVIPGAKYTEGGELIDELSDRMFQEIRNAMSAFRRLGFHVTIEAHVTAMLRQEDDGPVIARYARTMEVTEDPQ